MERMFKREDIDFDVLHGEIKENLKRQRELRAKGVKPVYYFSEGLKSKWLDYQSKLWFINSPNKEGIELDHLSKRMTVLCSILNYAKGRFHFKCLTKSIHKYYTGYPVPSDLDQLHERVFFDEWKQFLKQKEAEISVA